MGLTLQEHVWRPQVVDALAAAGTTVDGGRSSRGYVLQTCTRAEFIFLLDTLEAYYDHLSKNQGLSTSS